MKKALKDIALLLVGALIWSSFSKPSIQLLDTFMSVAIAYGLISLWRHFKSRK
ncbi:hypothetical protein N9R79_09820 [Vibrio sp.]|nr:hypothetical protein [Vibrio sp.]